MSGECKRSNSVGDFGVLLRGAHRAYNARFRALIPPANLTISQFQVLNSIRALEPCSLSTIGRYLKMDPATICGVAFRLERRGLVSLQKNNEDQRRLGRLVRQRRPRVTCRRDRVLGPIPSKFLPRRHGAHWPANYTSNTFVQPFVAYTTKDAWTFSLNTESTYNWVTDKWSVPVNATVAKLFKFGDQPVQIGGGPRYWLASPNNAGPRNFGARFFVTFLFPKK